ncbi:MAG: ABC transporter permease [Desulfobacterales bacterium]|nr:MAG: ABC transporter permease [Desulfobacterales bacterium]
MMFKRWKEHWPTIVVFIVLVVLFVGTSFVSEVFFTGRNLKNLLRQAAALGIVSTGQTFAILIGGIDLSIGSVVSLTSCLTTGILEGQGHLLIPVICLVIAIAVLIGFLNGFMITRTGVHPLIVTLGMMSIVQGAVLVYTKAPAGSIPESFMFLAWGEVGFLPFPVFYFAAVAFLGIFVLHRTAFGRYVYATGGNEEVARLSGVKTNRVKIVVYIISAFTAALTGLFLASRMGMGDPLAGERYMLDSIVPVLIGGTSLTGGKGGLVGTLPGVFIITILSNAMNLFGVSSYWQWIVQGAIIILAVAFYWKQK